MTAMKSIILGLLSLVVLETTYSQTNKFDIGIEGSPSYTFIHGNGAFYDEPTIGFLGGLFFQYNFNNLLSLRTDIAFERKGTKTTVVEDYVRYGEITFKDNYDYLTLPILIRTSFGKKSQFFVNVGPYFGYLLKQTFVSKGVNYPTSKADMTLNNNRFDASLSTGLGFSVPIKTKFVFSFELRNNLGLYDTRALPVKDNRTTKTNSTNFLLGFTYKLNQ